MFFILKFKFHIDITRVADMGGGTFFKVGGHKCTSIKLSKMFTVFIEFDNCDVTNFEMTSLPIHCCNLSGGVALIV